MDRISKEERSRVMARIGPRNTAPELAVRRAVHARGLRYRLHCRTLPGTPDLVLPRHRLVIFVHGCFWHRHPGCSACTHPKTRPEFWNAKFAANVARDARNVAELEALGFRVRTLWECEIEDPATLATRLDEIFPPAAAGSPTAPEPGELVRGVRSAAPTQTSQPAGRRPLPRSSCRSGR